MTATTTFRDTKTTTPHIGTAPIEANTILYKGTIVGLNAAGRAVNPTDGDGCNAFGVARFTCDNRTNSANGGAAGAADIDVDFCAGGFAFVGPTPKPFQKVFLVDNQTVSVDSAGGTRGVAGVVVEVRDGQAFVLFGPLAAAALGVAQDREIPVVIPQTPAWADGSANGFDPVTFAFGFNPTIDNQFLSALVPLPQNLDAGSDVIVEVDASISSVATDDDVTVLLAAHFDGGTNAAPTNDTVLDVERQTIAFVIPAASVPDGARSLMLRIRCDNNLDTADGYVHGVRVRYTTK